MKDSLKDFVSKHREAFDHREPANTVWSRVQATLPRRKQVTLWNSLMVWRAASLILLVLSFYLISSRIPQAPKKELAMAQREFSDLETFYSSQINEKVAMINTLESADEDDQFTQDFRKLQAMYEVLKEELKSHPGEKVRDAMVLNFLVQIDLLNQQIKRLEDMKKVKSKTSEV